MKIRVFSMIMMTVLVTPCHAQFGILTDVLGGMESSEEYKKAKERAQKEMDSLMVHGQQYQIPEVSAEQYKKMMEDIRKETKKRKKDKKKKNKKSGMDYSSKESQEIFKRVTRAAELRTDSVYLALVRENRQPTKEEADYLREKYGINAEYQGMNAYNDSTGVFAHIDGKTKPVGITRYETITDERPVPDLGIEEIRQYVRDYMTFLKNPAADKMIADSTQNYMVYKNRHAADQFKGTASFTFYTKQDVDPKNVFVFRVKKGVGCRYMEYQYSKITYRQSELNNYVSKQLVAEGYVDAKINQKLSDEELFAAIPKIELQFKVEKLLTVRRNNEKFVYTNTVPPAENAKVTTAVRKAGHVNALDISIDAEPGEYAFVIRDPEAEERLKHIGEDTADEYELGLLRNYDYSVLTEGAYFFSVK